jgi:hypothetical protein
VKIVVIVWHPKCKAENSARDTRNFIPEFQLLVCYGLQHQLSVTEFSDTFCHGAPMATDKWMVKFPSFYMRYIFDSFGDFL